MTISREHKPSEDRRKHIRKICSISFSYQTEDNSYREGSILDISAGGMFIGTDDDLSVGQIITLNIKYLSIQEPFMVKGRVVSKKPSGIGVKFEGLSQHHRDILHFMMR